MNDIVVKLKGIDYAGTQLHDLHRLHNYYWLDNTKGDTDIGTGDFVVKSIGSEGGLGAVAPVDFNSKQDKKLLGMIVHGLVKAGKEGKVYIFDAPRGWYNIPDFDLKLNAQDTGLNFKLMTTEDGPRLDPSSGTTSPEGHVTLVRLVEENGNRYAQVRLKEDLPKRKSTPSAPKDLNFNLYSHG